MPVIKDPVQNVFIQLVKGADPASFKDPRVVAARSFLQSALFLAKINKIRAQDVAAVADDLRRRHVTEAVITLQLDDARDRLQIPEDLLHAARR